MMVFGWSMSGSLVSIVRIPLISFMHLQSKTFQHAML